MHNHRSIQNETIRTDDYCLLIGANNSGETNVFKALRAFHESLIRKSQSTYALMIGTIPTCLERYLGLDIEKKACWKASKLLLAIQRNQIDPAKLSKFRAKLESLLALQAAKITIALPSPRPPAWLPPNTA